MSSHVEPALKGKNSEDKTKYVIMLEFNGLITARRGTFCMLNLFDTII